MPASRLRHARIDREFTQLAVATAIETSSSRYSLIERGLVQPTRRERARLAAVLEHSEDELFTAENRVITGAAM